MPTYEYECKSCSHSFEVIQYMADEPLKICPQCGKEIRRLINGGSGVIFKGPGFYATDKSRKGGESSSDKAPSQAPSQAPDKPAACAGCAAAQSGACAQSGAQSGAQAAGS